MNKKFTFLMTAMAMLFAIMGPRNVAWGQTTTVSYGWETGDDASKWVITETITQTENQGNTGSYAGKINTNHTYVQFKEKVKATSFSFAFKRTSNNNNYNVYIETSDDGSTWAAVETYAMSSFGNGTYSTKTHTFTNPAECYVRFHCYNTTAIRYVDDVTIEYTASTPSTDPSITVNPTTITWNNSPINVGLTDTISVSQANLTEGITISSTIGTVTPSTIAAGEDATDVTLTYTPTTTGNFEGEITFTSGETTATISVTGSAYDPSQVDTYTKVNSIADLTADDVFIIVGNNGSNYAMSNNNGTSSAPTAVAVTVTDDVITNPANTILWTISGNATDGYIFYPYGSTTTWLYCTDANNGLRVGNTTDSQDHRTFSIKDSYIFNNSRNRYLGIYSNSDWRSYTSINTNITGQTFAFYKKGSYTPPTVATPTFTPSAGTYTEAQDVTIACATEDASIYYTTDGTEPTNASTLYENAINVSTTTTIKAIAYSTTGEASDVATATYTIVAPPTSITVTGTAADLWKGDAFSHEGITVTANWGDNTQIDVTNDATYSGYDMNTAGEQTVTVTYMEKTASYNVTVQTIANTQATAYTIAQAIAIIDAGKDLNSEVYVAGTISQLDENNNAPQYKNLTYWITDESSETEFEVFRGRNLNNTDFNSNNDIEIGADVIVYGKITKFQTTYEFSQGNYLVSYTAPQVDKYDINLNQNEYGTISADLATASAGQTVTLTAIPIEHYHFVEWTVLDGDANEVPVTNNQFVMPASDVEVEATFEEDESVVFTYHYNGEEYLDGIDYEGTVITLEEDPELSPVGFSFVGWSTSIASTDVIVNTTYTLSEDVDFYAVFEKQGTNRGSSNFVKVTTEPEDWSGEYLLVYEGDSYNYAWTGVDAGQCHTDVVISDNVIASQPTDAVTLTLATMDGGYSIRVNGGTNDGKYIGKSSYSNGLDIKEIEQLNTLSMDEYGIIIAAEAEQEGVHCTMRYNKSSGDSNERFRYYKSGQEPVQLYKKQGSEPTANRRYTRVYDDVYTFAGTDLNVEGPSIIVSGYTLTVTGTMTNTNAANLIIEDGAQLVHSNADVAATLKKDVITYTNEDERTGWNMFAAPFTGTVSTSFGENYELYTYDESTHYWMDSQLDLTIGSGYLFAKPESNTTDFELAGTLQASNVNLQYNLSYTETLADGQDNVLKGFNLAGNPYPCNAYVDMDYQVLNAEGSGFINGKDIKPGDAILVQATGANQKITFSKNPLSGPNIVVDLCVSQNRGSVIDNARIRFGEGQAMNKFYLNESGTRLYIPQNGQDFAVVSTQTTTHEMPVNFKAEKNGTYTITANTENVEAEYIHLIDNMTGMDVDLLSTPSYTFSAKTSDYASRFKLVFNVKDEASASSANDFAYMSDGNLVIDNIEGEATLQIVDMMGRVLSTETVSDSYNKALNLRAGVYVLNLNGMTQKIVVR